MQISKKASNVIKDFMEAFSFDDMLHGSKSHELLIEHNKPSESNLFKRVSVLSPKRELSSQNISPFKSPIRKAHLNETYDVPVRSPIKYSKNFTSENSFGFKLTNFVILNLLNIVRLVIIFLDN